MEKNEMEMKGIYKLMYSLDKEPKELTVVVELLQTEGMHKPFQNLYYGIATVNGQPYEDSMLSMCVNAKLAAQRIGVKHREDLKENYKGGEHKFKIKKEELK